MNKPIKFKFKSGDSLHTVEATGIWSARRILESIVMDSVAAKAATLVNADKLFLGMPEEVFARFDRACHSVYQSLGGDWAEAGMKVFPRKDLVEVVLDADNVRTWGERNSKDWQQVYDTHVRPWLDKNYGTPAFHKVMKLIFPYSRYEA
jgi:hypothetical protein